jgi:putative endonuclease
MVAPMSPVPTPRTSRGRSGIAAEAIARRHLEGLGWMILGANVLAGRGELDLVALDPAEPGTLVVVEVRGVRSRRFGAPEESVGARKLARIRSAVLELLRSDWAVAHGLARPWVVRIDVVAIDLDPALGPGAGGPAVRHLRGVTAD